MDRSRVTYGFGLGGMAVALVLLLLASGALLTFVYDPAPERAYASIVGMQEQLLFGRLVRGLHYWSVNLLIVVALLHMLRAFATGRFHGQRRFTWVIGLGLLVCILVSAFTGYLLPLDQVAYWAITICTEMVTYIPGIGEALRRITLGGAEIGPATLINFYAMHTTILPAVLIALMVWHFWRIGRLRGVDEEPEVLADSGRFLRDLPLRETALALVAVAVVFALAALFEAPLGAPANPGLSPNPAKAPWYFLGFQELALHFHPLFAVFIIPLLAGLAMLLVAFVPYDSEPGGNWLLSAKGRRMAGVAGVTALVLTPIWIMLNEWVIKPADWLPDAPPVVVNGVVPFAVVLLAIVGFYVLMKRGFQASRSEAVQALFVLLGLGFTVLTVTGVWFRGEGMALTWPWTM